MVSHTPWWRDAVVYEVYLRSFADGDGDGIGDIAGLRSRLAYLADLGVDALWITPWYPSPMVDGGYDVADYRAIDPVYGTLREAEALIQEIHRHRLRVIIDLVPNHTSERHPWFTAALDAGPGSYERGRYLFRDGRDGAPPNDWQSVFGGPAWTQVPDGQWYLHLFAPEQPDLNWDHPQVREEFLGILRFWLDRGVDGVRVDVAHGLAKHPDLPDLGSDEEGLVAPPDRADHPHWDRPEVHDIYRAWRRVAESYGPDRIFVAEAWVARPHRLAAYVRPDELHTAFNVDFLRCSWNARSFRSVIDASIAATTTVGAPVTWVLSNHDVVRHLTRYARAYTRADTRHHPQPQGVDLKLGTRRARAAALLALALPGSVYLYQGEELGLEEVDDLPDDVLTDPLWRRSGRTAHGRDGCRVPLPWSGATSPFGFSPEGVRPWLPQPARWRDLTVAAQRSDPGSMLSLYRSALAIRRRHPALGDGGMRWCGAPPEVLVFRRDPGVLCAVNLSDVSYPLPAHDRVLLASEPVVGGALAPDAAVWLQE